MSQISPNVATRQTEENRKSQHEKEQAEKPARIDLGFLKSTRLLVLPSIGRGGNYFRTARLELPSERPLFLHNWMISGNSKPVASGTTRVSVAVPRECGAE